jgi:nitrous oxidase accessory protein NosD
MSRCIPVVVVISISFLCFLSGAVDNGDRLLPGARPAIDAANFSSLQAALDAVPEDGGLVQLPAGTFEINQPLRIQGGDITFQGVGTATHIKNTNDDGLPAIVVAHPEHKRIGNDRDHELWRVRLANLRVSGNAESGDGIVAHNINEIFLDGVTVSEHGGNGIHLSYCYEDARIVDSLITYNKQTGLSLEGCHDIVVSSNQFEENQDGLRCFDGFNLCMTGNCLDDHLGRGVVIENTYGSVVSGNMIEECRSAALVLDRDCYGTTISANVIAHNGAGIDVRDAHGCAISANTFTIMLSDAVRIGPDSGRIALCANSFSDSYVGAGVYKRREGERTAAGLVIAEAAEVFVNGNVFSGMKPAAIRINESDAGPSAIVDNFMVDTKPGVPAVRLDETALENNRAVEMGKR